MKPTLMLILVAALGCAGAPTATSSAPTTATASSPPGHPSPDPDNIARTPLPAGSLEDGLRAGAYFVMRVTRPGEAPVVTRTTFAAVDDAGCEMVEQTLDATTGAAIGAEQRARATWRDLESHAHFPADSTVITTETIDTTLGRLDTLRYEIRQAGDGEKTMKRLWFATSLPGPPVRYEQTLAGKTVFTMEMIETHRPSP